MWDAERKMVSGCGKLSEYRTQTVLKSERNVNSERKVNARWNKYILVLKDLFSFIYGLGEINYWISGQASKPPEYYLYYGINFKYMFICTVITYCINS